MYDIHVINDAGKTDLSLLNYITCSFIKMHLPDNFYCTSIKLLLYCVWKNKTTETIAVDLLFTLVSLATWGGYHGGPKEGIEKVQWEESRGRFPKPPVSAVLVVYYRTYDHLLVTTACFCDKQLLCSSRKYLYPTPPTESHWKFLWGGGGGSEAKISKGGGA